MLENFHTHEQMISIKTGRNYTGANGSIHNFAKRQGRSKLDNWGGGLIFIYSGSAQLISFEINCFYGL